MEKLEEALSTPPTGTMRALVLEEPGRMSLQQIEIPHPGPGEVLVKVEAATTCGTDLKAFLRGHPQIPMPGVLGHEYSGIVAAVGEGASFAVGDPVMGVHSAPCQECYWCQRDQENLCESIMSTKVLGSYAEYLLVPARIAQLNLFPKPDSISFEKACLLEPLSCVAQGVELLKVREDSRVLVIGPGAIGLMFVGALRLSGAREITLAGRNDARLAEGKKLGAQTCKVDAIPGSYDIVIECTGQVEVWEKSIDYVRRGGTLMLFGGCPGGTRASFDTKKVHYDQITILSPFHFGTKAVRQAREWLLNPLLDLSGIISGERFLEEGKQVFEDLQNGAGLKYVFKPQVPGLRRS
ncbi:zinc-dependent alcohol dehydrogenase [Fimbriimonas ginsengisoli]|uniref:zinc-dependent alcohol dehydrogenase n=1 Tax=Fimbriimonas ginsengisoli TaxID=1005039 RepID=UPI001D0E3EB1|nr:alcohol dehydrogenase catalytic domain-containing protein [Fimbriimonas ginsengisoli]